jgi:glutathione peroxidase
MISRRTIITVTAALVSMPVSITTVRASCPEPNHSLRFLFPLSEARDSAGGLDRSRRCAATRARQKDVPRWNFHRYLIGRRGYIAEVFAETVELSDTRIRTAIARMLAET